MTGQPAFEIYPSAEREFFYKVVNAELVFEGEGQGPGRPPSSCTRTDRRRAHRASRAEGCRFGMMSLAMNRSDCSDRSGRSDRSRSVRSIVLAGVLCCCWHSAHSQHSHRRPDWTAIEEETLEHFQALVRFDTSDPPGSEKPPADYL